MRHNEEIYRAVQYLYGKGIIRKDKDLAEKLGYSKATVSSYVSGKAKASRQFEIEFERVFNLKLSDFDKDENKVEEIVKEDGMQLLSETILQLKAEMQTNRQLMIETLAAASNRSVTEVQLMAESLLQHNLSKIVNELRQG